MIVADGARRDDEEFLHDPPPPEDRLWRHPSEMVWDTPQTARAPWGTALMSAAFGAFTVGALWLAVGTSSPGGGLATRWVSLVPVETVAPLVISADDWSEEVTRMARPGTVGVTEVDGTETIAGAVAIRDDGYYLTSGRAIGVADEVTVVSAKGVMQRAEVLGYDPATDMTVLRVDRPTTPAVVALASDLGEGDTVAIVNPSGTATEHVVTSEASMATTIDGERIVGMIELDGALLDTPAGSPAVDGTGAVVGVTAATAPGEPVAVVPIDVASDVADALIETGEAGHPSIGITLVDHVPKDPTSRSGALVTSVMDGGPASAGGVAEGDVIVRIDDEMVSSMAGVVAELRDRRPGEHIDMTVLREGREVGCRVGIPDQ